MKGHIAPSLSIMNNQNKFENAIKHIFEVIGENPKREGLLQTPTRVYKAFKFLTSGYTQNPSEIINQALFTSDNDQMVLVKDIEFYSMCEHHMLPIIGKAHIAYIPNGKVIGLSKIPRVVDIFARRLQIQEQLTEQIADAINETIKPQGVGIVITARHMCMEMRGVEKASCKTTTSALRGVFQSASVKKEFLDLIKL